jgi:hypothetical protein
VKFGLRRTFRNTTSAVSGWAAERQRADRLRPQIPAQHVSISLVGGESRTGEQGAQHPILVIEVEPVGLAVDHADGVSAGEFGRELEGGHVHARKVRWSAPGERGLLPVTVVGVEPFLGLGGRKDQFGR